MGTFVKLQNRHRWFISIGALATAGFIGDAVAALPPPPGPRPAAQQPVDPGPNPKISTPPAALPSLNTLEQNFFLAAYLRFQEVDSVSGAISGEAGTGLGPRFNLNSCAGCHAYPTVGGSSPSTNPQIAVATLDGATNKIPAFVTATGPVREARFVKNPDGTADGGVHDLYTITGRTDAAGCTIAQPDFAAAIAGNNIAYRIPTPVFGLGLVEATPDSALIAAKAGVAQAAASLGISGHFNTSANDGTITRFGWKAQNKSLLMFAGEAYNVEQGVTNELFPNERETAPNCQFNAQPEDGTNLGLSAVSVSPASDYSSDSVNFAAFMRYAAPLSRGITTVSSGNGARVFVSIGCETCHIQNQTTAPAPYTGNVAVAYQPYSDFAVHDMGAGLADGITQGNAGGSEFRTAPLWGLGQRLFMLHDGRTKDVVAAIQAHASPGSEANRVIGNFNALLPGQKQDLLNFLRSL